MAALQVTLPAEGVALTAPWKLIVSAAFVVVYVVTIVVVGPEPVKVFSIGIGLLNEPPLIVAAVLLVRRML